MGRSALESHFRRSTTKTISITSGKGGVGKTTLTSNLAFQLGKQGHRVLILDGDIGMANIDVMFGVKPKYTIEQVFEGEMSLREVMLEVSENVHLIPGGSGVFGLSTLNLIKKRILLEQVNDMEGLFDFMLIDTSPGIDDNVLYLNSAAQEILIVVTPDPASLTDSYALIKVLHQRYKENRFSIVCNMVRNEQESMQVYQRLSDVADRFLCVQLAYKGYIPLDTDLRKATRSQQLCLKMSPRCPSSFGLRMLAEKLSNYGQLAETKGGMQFFWEQLVGVA